MVTLETNLIFLGGCCKTNWRDQITEYLVKNKINYFNPVVDYWTQKDRLIENEIKYHSLNKSIFYFSEHTGIYSMAEFIDLASRFDSDLFHRPVMFFNPLLISKKKRENLLNCFELVNRSGSLYEGSLDYCIEQIVNSFKIISNCINRV